MWRHAAQLRDLVGEIRIKREGAQVIAEMGEQRKALKCQEYMTVVAGVEYVSALFRLKKPLFPVNPPITPRWPLQCKECTPTVLRSASGHPAHVAPPAWPAAPVAETGAGSSHGILLVALSRWSARRRLQRAGGAGASVGPSLVFGYVAAKNAVGATQSNETPDLAETNEGAAA